MQEAINITDPVRTKSAGYALLLQNILVNPDLVSRWKQNVAVGYQPRMFETLGAHLLAAGTALTGAPGAVVQLWMVPESYSPSHWAFKVRGEYWYQEFLQDVEDLHEEILHPMDYEPPRNIAIKERPVRVDLPVEPGRVPGAYGRATYLINHIEIPSRKLDEFSVGKRKVFTPIVSKAPFSWRLVASGARVTGGLLKGRGLEVPDYTKGLRVTEPVTTVVNLWRITGSESLPDMMLHVAENPAYQEFRQSTVAGEYQNLLLPVGNYDPEPRWAQAPGEEQDLTRGRWVYR